MTMKDKFQGILVLICFTSLYGLITLGVGAMANKFWPLHSLFVSIPNHWLWLLGGFLGSALIGSSMDGGLKEAASEPWLADPPASESQPSEHVQKPTKRESPPIYEVQRLNKNSSVWTYVAMNTNSAFAVSWINSNRSSASLRGAIAVRVIEKNSGVTVHSESL